MARPTKLRKIENIPTTPFFVPSDKNCEDVPKNTLLVEELEAIRLKDLEGLEQGEAAIRMQVSRPTFQRILICAREKIADSLINGKVIHVDGGNYTLNICPVKCLECGKEWMESYENIASIKTGSHICLDCKSTNLICGQNCNEGFCRGNCMRNGPRNGQRGQRRGQRNRPTE
ncbi:MAG TPA: DUF134 domain-containing protein [Clostridia bacterium]|nr:DUF134 domain-containing protein [Clostridia bacterium]